MSADARRQLHAIASTVRGQAEDLAVQAEVTGDATTDLAANMAIQNWLVLDLTARTGTDDAVELALDLIRDDFPELLPS